MAAAAVKLTEEFLRCTICTEVLQEPCTLVCYHTFCRKCVVNYTKTKPEAISAKSLLCPFCSKMTKVSDPDKPVEEWADDVKPSFVIQGLLDSFGPGSKDMTNCQYCKDIGETIPAVSWCSVCDDAVCEKCAAMHKQIPATRNHDVIVFTGDTKTTQRRKAMCEEHTNECIEFVCKDCKKLICQKCGVVYHRKCSSVVTIESELTEMKTTLMTKRKSLLTDEQTRKDRVREQKLKLTEVSESSSELESLIRSSCDMAREKIKQKENTLINKLKEATEIHLGQLKADIKAGEMSMQMYHQEVELIDKGLETECQVDMYRMCQWFEEERLEEAVLNETVDKIIFEQDVDRLVNVLDNLPLGDIEVVYKGNEMHGDGGFDLQATPVLHDTINIRLPSDKMSPSPLDVMMMVVNNTHTLVLTDDNNSNIKSFYTRNNQACQSNLHVGGRPSNIAKLSHNQVIVSFVNERKLVTVGVTPDLAHLSRINTSKGYYGLTALTSSTLAAGSRLPPCVDIIDTAGNVLRSFMPLVNEVPLVKRPNFLCTSRTGNIIVSDEGTRRILCLAPEGDVLFELNHTGNEIIQDPLGITSTNSGDILVADCLGHRIIHLTESGDFVRNILTSKEGINYPRGICVDGLGRLHICYFREGTIKVFSSKP
ncbi:E3 ubiquitin-protein ligase TRIM32-like [Haliotis rubra]|uniref:E3 ubiquitin-protein ligase TRIM32-like n=1 Tax=Haliotis rubra TaxID=36100 RepID=UPI001EE5EEDB|nr:E3 ubiquitin-protein ligase TRIM32-like [Haliotis rubra]XP_046583600.1 E3 ubiquitin-protein ligase TRIM32-like [Haliotis rubra]